MAQISDVLQGDYVVFNYFGGHTYGGTRFVLVNEITPQGDIIGVDLKAEQTDNIRHYKCNLISNLEIFNGVEYKDYRDILLLIVAVLFGEYNDVESNNKKKQNLRYIFHLLTNNAIVEANNNIYVLEKVTGLK